MFSYILNEILQCIEIWNELKVENHCLIFRKLKKSNAVNMFKALTNTIKNNSKNVATKWPFILLCMLCVEDFNTLCILQTQRHKIQCPDQIICRICLFCPQESFIPYQCIICGVKGTDSIRFHRDTNTITHLMDADKETRSQGLMAHLIIILLSMGGGLRGGQ